MWAQRPGSSGRQTWRQQQHQMLTHQGVILDACVDTLCQQISSGVLHACMP